MAEKGLGGMAKSMVKEEKMEQASTEINDKYLETSAKTDSEITINTDAAVSEATAESASVVESQSSMMTEQDKLL